MVNPFALVLRSVALNGLVRQRTAFGPNSAGKFAAAIAARHQGTSLRWDRVPSLVFRRYRLTLRLDVSLALAQPNAEGAGTIGVDRPLIFTVINRIIRAASDGGVSSGPGAIVDAFGWRYLGRDDHWSSVTSLPKFYQEAPSATVRTSPLERRPRGFIRQGSATASMPRRLMEIRRLSLLLFGGGSRRADFHHDPASRLDIAPAQPWHTKAISKARALTAAHAPMIYPMPMRIALRTTIASENIKPTPVALGAIGSRLSPTGAVPYVRVSTGERESATRSGPLVSFAGTSMAGATAQATLEGAGPSSSLSAIEPGVPVFRPRSMVVLWQKPVSSAKKEAATFRIRFSSPLRPTAITTSHHGEVRRNPDRYTTRQPAIAGTVSSARPSPTVGSRQLGLTSRTPSSSRLNLAVAPGPQRVARVPVEAEELSLKVVGGSQLHPGAAAPAWSSLDLSLERTRLVHWTTAPTTAFRHLHFRLSSIDERISHRPLTAEIMSGESGRRPHSERLARGLLRDQRDALAPRGEWVWEPLRFASGRLPFQQKARSELSQRVGENSVLRAAPLRPGLSLTAAVAGKVGVSDQPRFEMPRQSFVRPRRIEPTSDGDPGRSAQQSYQSLESNLSARPMIVSRLRSSGPLSEAAAPTTDVAIFRPLAPEAPFAGSSGRKARELTESDIPAVTNRVYALLIERIQREKRMRGR
jgi:hypothetical protein